MMKRVMKHAVPAALLGALAGVSAGAAPAPSETGGERRTPIARRVVVQDVAAHGSHDGPFSLGVEPAAVVESKTGREQLEFEIRLTSHTAVKTSHRYMTLITDDAGKPVAAPTKSDLFALTGDTDEQSFSLRTTELPDGYYQLRVTAAGSDGNGAAGTMDAERYFRVKRGRVTPLTFSEWATRSHANRANEG